MAWYMSIGGQRESVTNRGPIASSAAFALLHRPSTTLIFAFQKTNPVPRTLYQPLNHDPPRLRHYFHMFDEPCSRHAGPL